MPFMVRSPSAFIGTRLQSVQPFCQKKSACGIDKAQSRQTRTAAPNKDRRAKQGPPRQTRTAAPNKDRRAKQGPPRQTRTAAARASRQPELYPLPGREPDSPDRSHRQEESISSAVLKIKFAESAINEILTNLGPCQAHSRLIRLIAKSFSFAKTWTADPPNLLTLNRWISRSCHLPAVAHNCCNSV